MSIIRIYLVPREGIDTGPCHIYDIPTTEVNEKHHMNLQRLDGRYLDNDSPLWSILNPFLFKFEKKSGTWAQYQIRTRARVYVAVTPYDGELTEKGWDIEKLDSRLVSVQSVNLQRHANREYGSSDKIPARPEEVMKTYTLSYRVL